MVSNTYCMLTDEQCLQILNKKGKKYTKEEAKEIKKLLDLLADIELENYQNSKQ